jgi:hypothetical protein
MEDTDLKTRSSAIQKIVEAARPKHEPEVQAAMDAYDEVRAQSREAPMLEIRFLGGRLMSFDYARLGESEFLPEGKIILRFGRKEVIAEGKNLRRLYTTITERRQRFICEGTDEEEAGKPEDGPHIDKISIQVVPEDQL